MKQEEKKIEDKKRFAFDKQNFIMVAIGMFIVIIGFLLMSGPSSSEKFYQSDIFSLRRIKVAPVVCFIGYIFIIFAILRTPKDGNKNE